MEWDVRLFHLINGLAGYWPWLDDLMRALSRPDYFIVPSAGALLYWIWKEKGQMVVPAMVLGASIAGADFVGFQLKNFVDRPRPCRALDQVHRLVGCGRNSSFPSNHAVNTAASAVFFQRFYPRTGMVVLTVVLLVGFSRVFVGAHYVTDVIGGWLVGSIVTWTLTSIAARWMRRDREIGN